LSALRSEDSNCKGGDAAGSGMGRIGGDDGSGGDGICGNGDDNKVSGDGGRIGIAKNLSASSLVKDSVGGWGLKDILAVTRNSGMYPGKSAVGEKAAGSGCSSAGKTSSFDGIYSGYTGFATTYAYGSFGITGSPSTPGDTSPDRPSQALDTVVYVIVESSESDMIVSENTK
nr:hypothetical protein [Tanacetum cinerariifolium]